MNLTPEQQATYDRMTPQQRAFVDALSDPELEKESLQGLFAEIKRGRKARQRIETEIVASEQYASGSGFSVGYRRALEWVLEALDGKE